MSKILLVDFDGTIVEHMFPDIGRPMRHAFPVLRYLQRRYRLILHTCREDHRDTLFARRGDDFPNPTGTRQHHKKHYLRHAVEFCAARGVTWDAVNEPLPDADFRDPEHFIRRKPSGHFHLDDRNFGGFPGWKRVGQLLLPPEEWQAAVAEPEDDVADIAEEPTFLIPSVFR